MSKEIDNKKIDENKSYIALSEAAENTGYSQEYLSLRARQGKLQAVKIGRNWVTTKDWLQSYLQKVEEYKNNHQINGVVPKIQEEKLSAVKVKTIVAPFEREKEEAISKQTEPYQFVPFSAGLKEKSIKLLLRTPGPKKKINAFALALVLFLILLSGVIFLNFTSPNIKQGAQTVFSYYQDSINNLKNIASQKHIFSNIKTSFKNTFQEVKKASWDSAVKAAKNFSSSKTADIFAGFRKIYQSAFARVKLSFKKLGRDLAGIFKPVTNFTSRVWKFSGQIVQNIRNTIVRLFSHFLTAIGKVYTKIASIFGKKQISMTAPQESATRPELTSKEEGSVVVPSAGEEKDEETKQKLKMMFSDEVIIEATDESSGIITPIFKTRKGDGYLYMMVPVKKQGTQ